MTLLAGLLLALVAALNACLFMQARAHERRIDRLLTLGQTERATPNPDTAALIATVENLCQRIQAPEAAVLEHAINNTDQTPQPTLPDDDTGWWSTQSTKEALAEALMTAEIDG